MIRRRSSIPVRLSTFVEKLSETITKVTGLDDAMPVTIPFSWLSINSVFNTTNCNAIAVTSQGLSRKNLSGGKPP